MLKIGLGRGIDEDDVYAVTNSMRSVQNTEKFAKLWQLELKKKQPSILRVILKVHGLAIYGVGILFSIGEVTAKYALEKKTQ